MNIRERWGEKQTDYVCKKGILGTVSRTSWKVSWFQRNNPFICRIWFLENFFLLRFILFRCSNHNSRSQSFLYQRLVRPLFHTIRYWVFPSLEHRIDWLDYPYPWFLLWPEYYYTIQFWLLFLVLLTFAKNEDILNAILFLPLYLTSFFFFWNLWRTKRGLKGIRNRGIFYYPQKKKCSGFFFTLVRPKNR